MNMSLEVPGASLLSRKVQETLSLVLHFRLAQEVLGIQRKMEAYWKPGGQSSTPFCMVSKMCLLGKGWCSSAVGFNESSALLPIMNL